MSHTSLRGVMNRLLDPTSTPPAEGEPLLLHGEGNHRIYWVGIRHATAFRCNTYLLIDGEEALLIDPGSRAFFPQVRESVARVVEPNRVMGLVLCHQDPDVAASLPDWLALNPRLTVFTSPRTQVLLPHYGVSGYRFYDVEAEPEYQLAGGGGLRFIGAPFLHSPMAFATFDQCSGALFSGDIFAAIDNSWQLVVTQWAAHTAKMDLFHLDYMASHVAAQGFARRLRELPLQAILPQHGSIIPHDFVPDAIGYLEQLQCGLDVLYPDLS